MICSDCWRYWDVNQPDRNKLNLTIDEQEAGRLWKCNKDFYELVYSVPRLTIRAFCFGFARIAYAWKLHVFKWPIFHYYSYNVGSHVHILNKLDSNCIQAWEKILYIFSTLWYSKNQLFVENIFYCFFLTVASPLVSRSISKVINQSIHYADTVPTYPSWFRKRKLSQLANCELMKFQ